MLSPMAAAWPATQAAGAVKRRYLPPLIAPLRTARQEAASAVSSIVGLLLEEPQQPAGSDPRMAGRVFTGDQQGQVESIEER
jgi:hypothetical protein